MTPCLLFCLHSPQVLWRGIDSEIGGACIPKKAEEPIIQTAKKTRHGSCWYERLPVAADKENEVADDAQRMGAVR